MHIELRKAGDVVIVDLNGKLSAGLGARTVEGNHE